MAYTTIDDPSAHFQAVLWAGNGSNPRNITNTGNSDLKGDWIWTKNRTDAGTNNVTCNSTIGFDAPTGQGLSGGPYGGQLSTDSAGLASTPAATYGYVSAHLTNGFTVACVTTLLSAKFLTSSALIFRETLCASCIIAPLSRTFSFALNALPAILKASPKDSAI